MRHVTAIEPQELNDVLGPTPEELQEIQDATANELIDKILSEENQETGEGQYNPFDDPHAWDGEPDEWEIQQLTQYQETQPEWME